MSNKIKKNINFKMECNASCFPVRKSAFHKLLYCVKMFQNFTFLPIHLASLHYNRPVKIH